MLEKWQFNTLFVVGVGAVVLLLVGPIFGLKVAQNPTALTGVGAILTYILTQKKSLTKDNHPKTDSKKSSDAEEAKDNGDE